MTELEQLKRYSTVVADTGNFLDIARYSPQEATTNPTLILKAVQDPAYAPLLAGVVAQDAGRDMAELVERILVRFGLEILKVVPGRVSTEVDARLSFDTAATVERARKVMALYEAAGIPRERILIKIAATWEGMQAARILEREGIHCNLTLVFSLCQAQVCGDAGVRLISPFVGRIYDWYKKAAGSTWEEAANSGARDPGVQSVTRIHQYYKQRGITTQIMGASFRNLGQIRALAGCELLTISPQLLSQLEASKEPLAAVLGDVATPDAHLPALGLEEPDFRFQLNQDAMATEKLAEGIRSFTADTIALEGLIQTARERAGATG